MANKIDTMQDESLYNELENLAKEKGLEIFKISAVTGEGVNELINKVAEELKVLPKEDIIDIEERMVYTLKEKDDEYTIRKEKDDFVVEGKAIQRLMGRVNVEDNESLFYLYKCLKNMGVENKLKSMGVKEGDTVRLLDWHFEWYE